MSNIIKYKIQGKSSTDSKYKNINFIKQKSQKIFKFPKAEGQFQLVLNLSMKTQIEVVQIKTRQVDMFQVSLFLDEHSISTYPKKLNKKQVQGKPFQIKISSENADKLRIKLLNIPDPRKSQIHYILIKGVQKTKQQSKQSKKSKNKKQIQIPSKSVLKQEHKKIFQQRKTKSDAMMLKEQLGLEMDVEQLTQLITKHKQQQKQRQENPDIKRQIEKLQKQYQQNCYNMQMQQERERDYLIQDYQIIPFTNDVEEIMKNVTTEWLQAHRRMEYNFGVSQEYSLSRKINEKYLRGQKFCFGDFSKQCFDKDELGKKIKRLGGQIIEKPIDNCIILTEELKGNKVKIGKEFQNIRFISPKNKNSPFNYIKQHD